MDYLKFAQYLVDKGYIVGYGSMVSSINFSFGVTDNDFIMEIKFADDTVYEKNKYISAYPFKIGSKFQMAEKLFKRINKLSKV